MASLTVNTSNRQAMLAANSQYAASRPAALGQLAMPPAKKYLIVTCIDARIDPAAAFGINLGDAHVIRNAGGSAVAALRDIIISTHFLGVTEVFIIKHKDCGMKFLNSQPKSIFELLYPDSIACPGASSIVDMPWYDFECPFAAVRQDWWYVQNHPAIRANDPAKPDRKIVIHGFVYDPVTGAVEDVQPRLPASQNPTPGSQPNGPDPAPGSGGAGGGNQQSGVNAPTAIQQPSHQPAQRPTQQPYQQPTQPQYQPYQQPTQPQYQPYQPYQPYQQPTQQPAHTVPPPSHNQPSAPQNNRNYGGVKKSGSAGVKKNPLYGW